MAHFRPAVRAIVLDEHDHALLGRLEFTESGRDFVVWTVPGGGIEPGEDPMTALRRELAEEIGLDLAEDPPHVWHQQVRWPRRDNGFDGVRNDYFLVRTRHFDPRGSMTDEQLAEECLMGFRWWSPTEIQDYAGPATFAPPAFPALLRALLSDGVPAAVIVLDE